MTCIGQGMIGTGLYIKLHGKGRGFVCLVIFVELLFRQSNIFCIGLFPLFC